MFDGLLKFFDRQKKVYALVGRSGSGKSFRAQFVADKYGIKLIIDDGLLIKGERIVTGKSAKQELSVISAVRRALFADEEHCKQTKEALAKEHFKKILIIGTSEKMVCKIASVLELPMPSTIINIEDIATEEEIQQAIKSRYTDGKHVIPVSPQQITRKYPHIVSDSIKILERRMGIRNKKVYEKTVVKPEFTKLEKTAVSDSVVAQIINQSLDQYSNMLKLESVKVNHDEDIYEIEAVLRTPIKVSEEKTDEIHDFLIETLERYANMQIKSLSLTINTWK